MALILGIFQGGRSMFHSRYSSINVMSGLAGVLLLVAPALVAAESSSSKTPCLEELIDPQRSSSSTSVSWSICRRIHRYRL